MEAAKEFGKFLAVCVLLQAAWAASSTQPDVTTAGSDSSRRASSDTHPTRSSAVSEIPEITPGEDEFDDNLYIELLRKAEERKKEWAQFVKAHPIPSRWLW